MRRDIFQAIADPTRRSILTFLASQSITAGAIADKVDAARSTISKHLQILTACGLVEANQRGREIYYEIKIDKMKEIDVWLDQLLSIWETRFDNLDEYITKFKNPETMDEITNREMRITRTFKAPIELMWEVWTNPEHIINWWGPKVFTSTIEKMDFKEGGEWRLTMHGPDGINYPNRSIFKEIIPLKKIVFEHFNPHFITTVLFEPKGDETQIDWSLLFDTKEMRDTIIKAHKADEGQRQNLERLEKYLSNLQLES
ncbi:MAG TPA: metalloregulator ArsR/SmtB family transcription factor [Ohtaekwangia sp.]|nr:metalloregulator ArsR/SmtB family transcription factor [Ohtaekwangia sp.]